MAFEMPWINAGVFGAVRQIYGY